MRKLKDALIKESSKRNIRNETIPRTKAIPPPKPKKEKV